MRHLPTLQKQIERLMDNAVSRGEEQSQARLIHATWPHIEVRHSMGANYYKCTFTDTNTNTTLFNRVYQK